MLKSRVASVGVHLKIQQNIVFAKKHAWSPSPSTCTIDEYLKSCAYVKSHINDLIITCNLIVETPETANKL